MNRFLVFFLALLITGCATKLRVTFDSDPPDAVIFYDGSKEGYAPQTFRFDVTEQEKQRGFVEILNTKAVWASGAKTETGSIRIDLKKGLSQSYTLQRPAGAPRREVDIRFSQELARTRAMQRQAAAQEAQTAAQERQAAALERQAAAQEERARAERYRSTNCTSTNFGGTISTSCY